MVFLRQLGAYLYTHILISIQILFDNCIKINFEKRFYNITGFILCAVKHIWWDVQNINYEIEIDNYLGGYFQCKCSKHKQLIVYNINCWFSFHYMFHYTNKSTYSKFNFTTNTFLSWYALQFISYFFFEQR